MERCGDGLEAEEAEEALWAVRNRERIVTSVLEAGSGDWLSFQYMPGTHTQHVKGLSAEHLPSSYLEPFKRLVNKKSGAGENTLSRKSCALVGNSGQLKRTFFGKDIDKHDRVFRFNAAPTKGYEATAGGRTDVRVINDGMGRALTKSLNGRMSSKLLNSLLGSSSTVVWLSGGIQVARSLRKALVKRGDWRSVVWIPSDIGDGPRRLFHQYYAEELKALMDAHPHHSSKQDEWVAKLKEVRAGEQRLDMPASSHMFGKPSLGVALVYLLKDLCGSLDVYGFGNYDSEGNPGDYKYYNVMSSVGSKTSPSEVITGPIHSFDFELELELAMANDGLLRMCQYRPGNDTNNQHCSSVESVKSVAMADEGAGIFQDADADPSKDPTVLKGLRGRHGKARRGLVG